ncbi:MAG: carbohydrate ABC transporter permease [Roseburia sp.]|nr:carbohydrate ABC transporter permease [Roseburia sp.]
MRKLMTGMVSLLGLFFFVPIGATVVLSFWQEGAFSFRGYGDLLFDCFTFYPMFWNSVFYGLAITAGQLIIGLLCAFGFSQGRFKGKKILYLGYIVLMMMPLQVTILPNYIGLRDMGLLNTPQGIILPLFFSPFCVVVMHQYMEGIDNGMIEAARLETNSMLRIILTAVVPQIKVCIFAVVLFVFTDCWNMLEQPMLFLKEDKYRTLSIFLASTEKYVGNVLFPASVIFMIPVLLFYQYFNEYLENGLCLGKLSD